LLEFNLAGKPRSGSLDYNEAMDLRMQTKAGSRVKIGGREYDYFSGTGYLGLQNHPLVIQAAIEALSRYGFSTATSRGSYGEHDLYSELERQACAYFGAEKIIYLPTGYLASAALVQGSAGGFEHVFIDGKAHYSLWDAAEATNRPITPFHHLDPQSLRDSLQRELRPHERPLILSDGLFPISGEIAPLPAYVQLAEQWNGCVYVDDAHGVGALGPQGRGTADYYQLVSPRCRSSATLAKALGGFGGIIWGERAWIDEIGSHAHLCDGASPLPLPVAAASAQALALAGQGPALRERLWANVTQARSGLRGLGWELADSPSPVICLDARQDLNLNRIRAGLFAQGIAVSFVRSYTSAPAGGCLRIAIFADHSPEQIERLIESLRAYV
jgi:glycine C-acetyltransferase/8-amino-7-oxononanoate synthase